jgi:hypothetical protein
MVLRIPRSYNPCINCRDVAISGAPSSIPGKICECISVAKGKKAGMGKAFFLKKLNMILKRYIKQK